MMTINIPSLWPILLALISGLIGYQFSRRGSEKDRFLDGLTKSYKEVYYPMHKWLVKILQTENKDAKDLLLKEFFSHYSSIDSDLKWMADFSLLKDYFDLEKWYLSLLPQQYDLFIENLTKFSSSIKEEFHEAHSLIYLNYNRSKRIMEANPAKRILVEFILLVYYVSLFLTYLSLIYLFLSIVNWIQPVHLQSNWLSIYLAFLLLMFDAILFFCTVPFCLWFFPQHDSPETKSLWGQFKMFFERL